MPRPRAALVLAAVAAALAAPGCDPPKGTDPAAAPRVVAARGDLAADEQATIELFEKASPSVVHVVNTVLVRRGLGRDPTEIPRGSASGFLWDAQGHVVTNFHVVEGGSEYSVAFTGARPHRATLVGTAAAYDLAVLKIDPGDATLVPLPIGTSGNLRVGQKVFAIGNPFGLDQTLTSGLVSGLGREIASPAGRTIYDVVQTDAAVNPGNSGGPLLDSAGRVIGVNTQIASPSGGSAGISFAIPIDIVNRVVPELIRTGGRYVRPVLGVLLSAEGGERPGAVVDQVFRGSGAHAAGLLPEDVIVAVGGEKVASRTDLFRIVDRRAPKERIEVTYLRGDREAKTVIELSGTE